MRVPAVLLLVLAACGPATAPPAPPLEPDDFVPGGLPAAADTAEIRLSFGDPDSITMDDNPFEADAPLIIWSYDGFEVRFGAGGRALGWMLYAPGEATMRGVQVGDPMTAVLRLYGEPSARMPSGWTYLDSTMEEGLHVIDFAVAADTVRRIYIGRAVD